MLEYTSCNANLDGLFYERLEAFMQNSQKEITLFAAREALPYEQIQRTVAEWHWSHLLSGKLADLQDSNTQVVASALRTSSSERNSRYNEF